MNVMWYIPAGLIETIYWVVALWCVSRFCRDLERPIHNNKPSVYVRSEFTDFEGWVKIK